MLYQKILDCLDRNSIEVKLLKKVSEIIIMGRSDNYYISVDVNLADVFSCLKNGLPSDFAKVYSSEGFLRYEHMTLKDLVYGKFVEQFPIFENVYILGKH